MGLSVAAIVALASRRSATAGMKLRGEKQIARRIKCRVIARAILRFGLLLEQRKENGHEQQSDERGKQQAANDGERERFLQFRSGTEAKRQRQETEKRGESGHQDGADADFAGFDKGL